MNGRLEPEAEPSAWSLARRVWATAREQRLSLRGLSRLDRRLVRGALAATALASVMLVIGPLELCRSRRSW